MDCCRPRGHHPKVASDVARGIDALTGLSTRVLNTGTVTKPPFGAGDEKNADSAHLRCLPRKASSRRKWLRCGIAWAR